MVKKLFLLILLTLGGITVASARETEVMAEKDTVWTITLKGITLAKREIHRIDIAYDSTLPDGSPVRLSGSIAIPAEVFNGEQPCDGTILYNRFTLTSDMGTPTSGLAEGPDMLLAVPLKLNYILVASDFAGFGIDNQRPQYFLYDTANAQASIDCLLAARELLDQMQIEQGKWLFNVGYSSGGYDAMAVQKLRDNKYRDQISFDKTIAGGAPYDLSKAYDEFIAMKDSVAVYPLGLILIMESYNKYENLGYTFADYLQEPYASKMDEWVNSHKYTSTQISDSIGSGHKFSEIFTEDLLNPESEISIKLRAAIEARYIGKDWNFDPSQNLVMMHLRDDNYVPVQSARELLKLLHDNGYTPYIIPYKTNLQTNFIIKNSSHSYVGGTIWGLHVASALFAHPILYYDDELNPAVAHLLDNATLMGIVKQLEAAGIDVKKLVQSLVGGGSGEGGKSIFEILADLDKKLQEMGSSMSEVMQMLDDSGITLMDIMELYQYLTQNDEETESGGEEEQPDVFNAVSYLTNWAKSKGVDIYED